MVKKNNNMKKIGFILCLSIIISSCNKLHKDEKLSFQKTPYIGELRTDGYYYTYYHTLGKDYTLVNFFFRDGIFLSAGSYESLDINVVEQKMVGRYQILRENKIGWGVFKSIGDNLSCEVWTTSSGGGLPVYKWNAIIENDTTFRRNDSNDIWHFRKFSPKPDRTNNFIK